LLAQALRILCDQQARKEIGVGLDLLVRIITAVNPYKLKHKGHDPWLYFYEEFLAAYDKKLRKDRGVYYTPVEVIHAQVRLVSHLLRNKLGKTMSYADRDVVLLDPATGTGCQCRQPRREKRRRGMRKRGNKKGWDFEIYKRVVHSGGLDGKVAVFRSGKVEGVKVFLPGV